MKLQDVADPVGAEQTGFAGGVAATHQFQCVLRVHAHPAIGILSTSQGVGTSIEAISIAQVIDVEGFPAGAAAHAVAFGADIGTGTNAGPHVFIVEFRFQGVAAQQHSAVASGGCLGGESGECVEAAKTSCGCEAQGEGFGGEIHRLKGED
ncbi:hypothetical protein PMIT1306_00381 [Prochlorococcus sp. MIT 1306]|nr:hypothetical protein PMIT1306_00381 [Prochlorococcus sp. MIT 1306]